MNIKNFIKPLNWGDIWFVVHSSGSFEFFADEFEASTYGYNLGRGYYVFNEEAVKTYGNRLVKDKEVWQKEYENIHIQKVLSALDLEKLKRYVYNPIES